MLQEITEQLLCFRDKMQLGMSHHDDREYGPYFRQVATGLAVAASTITADFANLGGHADVRQVLLISLAGLLAAAVVVLTSVKKNLTAM